MTSKTQWVAGFGAGLTWTPAFGTEANTLANAGTVLSSVTISNSSALDIFMDLSLLATLSSSTIAAGANFALWMMALQQDAATWGDNSLSTTPGSTVPGLFLFTPMPIRAAATQTTVYSQALGLVLPPGDFRIGVQNNIGFTLTAFTLKYRTYDLNLNA